MIVQRRQPVLQFHGWPFHSTQQTFSVGRWMRKAAIAKPVWQDALIVLVGWVGVFHGGVTSISINSPERGYGEEFERLSGLGG